MSNEKIQFLADVADLIIELTVSLVVIVAGVKYIFWG